MKRKKSFLKKITLLFVLFFLIHVGHTFVTNDAVGLPEKLQGFGTIKQEEHPIASDKYGWELVLVNRDNYIPDDYEMDLMELSNGQKIDSRIYPYLGTKEMLLFFSLDCNEIVRSGCYTEFTK